MTATIIGCAALYVLAVRAILGAMPPHDEERERRLERRQFERTVESLKSRARIVGR